MKSAIDKMTHEQRLSSARVKLVLNHPFWASLATGMPMVITDTIPTRVPGHGTVYVPNPTAATDGDTLYFNPAFLDTLTDDEVLFLVAHEVGHPMLMHIFRRGDRDMGRWNRAADYVLNDLLVNEGIGTMPSCGLYDPRICAAGGHVAEGVYRLLQDNDDAKGSGGGSGGALDTCLDASGATQAEQAGKAAEWRLRVTQAANAAKMQGALSDNMKRFVEEHLRVKEDYWVLLQDFLVKAKLDMRTYARPNRRFLTQGLYTPSRTGEKLGDIVFAVDCSVSIGGDELADFGARVKLVHEDMKPDRLHVIYFDAEVCHVDTYSQDDTVHITPHGGGGTRFSPVFQWLEGAGVTPDACVFLTDLYCDDFGLEPEYPVLWVTTGRTSAPFGRVVKMEL